MEQEKHLTKPYNQKALTRASARHLRRKRLKDARRAEKQQQLSQTVVNGVHGELRTDPDDATRNDNTEEASRSDAKSTQKSEDVFLNLVLPPRPGLEDSLRFDTQYALCNDYIEIDRALERECQKLKLADLASEEQRLCQQRLSKYLESSKCYCETVPAPQATNGEKRKRTVKTSSSSNATHEDSPEDTPSSPVSLISNTDCDCPNTVSWKSSAARSSRDGLSLDDLMEFVSYTNSVRNDICVSSEQADVTDYCANHTLAVIANENGAITEVCAQSDLVDVVEGEETNEKASREEAVSPAKMADKKSSSSGKTKEQNKREMKSGKGTKSAESVSSNVKSEFLPGTRKSPKKNTETGSVKSIAETSWKTNTTLYTQSAQSISEVKSKDDTGENSVQVDTSVSLKNDEVEASSKKSASPVKVVERKPRLPEKTREEIKVEREAKKAAKAAAKAKAKAKTTETPENAESSDVQNDRPATKCETLSAETNVTTDARISQSARTAEKGSEESTVQHSAVHSSNACTPNVDACKKSDFENKSDGKSKMELRAERRAKQEAQRAAKQQQLSNKRQQPTEQRQQSSAEDRVKQSNVVSAQSLAKVASKSTKEKTKDEHQVNLFKQLYLERELSAVKVNINSNIHPAIMKLGVQYAYKKIVGSNARCVGLLEAIKELIRDFEKPPQTDFIRGLETNLKESMAYLHHCRPVAVSMQNAMRHLKLHMTQFSSNTKNSDEEVKEELTTVITTYIKEQIMLADKAISTRINTKISSGDVILTYGYSSLIHEILLEAHNSNKDFSVIVVDGRPWLEGRQQLKRLLKYEIECSYIMINAVSYIMPKVSKVFFGAHAILANGAVMSRVGTAQIALMAKAFNVPVLVACETHKSCERVLTDSIVYNELGHADELVNSYEYNDCRKSPLTNWRTRKTLNLLNITYDVTPADLVTAVVTELAILPCTSVPVILRIKPSEF